MNKEAKKITASLALSDRVKQIAKKPAFITLKDHKENFESHPKCRLINPSKSEIGKIAKQILDVINKDIRQKSNLKQWTSTSQVME